MNNDYDSRTDTIACTIAAIIMVALCAVYYVKIIQPRDEMAFAIMDCMTEDHAQSDRDSVYSDDAYERCLKQSREKLARR